MLVMWTSWSLALLLGWTFNSNPFLLKLACWYGVVLFLVLIEANPIMLEPQLFAATVSLLLLPFTGLIRESKRENLRLALIAMGVFVSISIISRLIGPNLDSAVPSILMGLVGLLLMVIPPIGILALWRSYFAPRAYRDLAISCVLLLVSYGTWILRDHFYRPGGLF